MKKISETNIFPKFDLYSEYKNIEFLISEKPLINVPWVFDKLLTIEEYIQETCFLNWNLRGTFLSVGEMREKLGIDKVSINKENINNDIILNFLQYAANCCDRVNQTDEKNNASIDEVYLTVILKNISALADRLGAQMSMDEKTLEIFIVYKDDIAEYVSDEYPKIKGSITEYRKYDYKGDLQRKGEILGTLFKRLEEDEKKFKGTTYERICNDTTFLFNKTGIRHWVDNDKIACKTFLTMQPNELEMWYDRTFTMFLSCMVISKYLDIKKEIDDIKSKE